MKKIDRVLPYPVYVAGDFRKAGTDGIPAIYPKDGKAIICFGGGAGLYHFARKQWRQATNALHSELLYVIRLEKWTKQRQHKGWFYYMLAQCYQQLGDDEFYQSFLKKAQEEDHLSYGDNANTFPAGTVTG